MKPNLNLRRIFPVFLLIISPLSCLRAMESPDQIAILREKLKSADDSTSSSIGTKAYIQLLRLGDPGFQALSDSWVYDHIPEENWLRWKTNLLNRYGNGKYSEDEDDYAYFLNHRMAYESEYAVAAAKRLLQDKIYSNDFLLAWLRAGTGPRRVGYMALSQKYPDIPYFDYQASPADRSVQLEKIRSYLLLK